MSVNREPARDRRLTLACVIDLVQPEGLPTRRKAYDDIVKAAKELQVTLQLIQFERLDFGEAAVLDIVYSADVAVVDMVSLSLFVTVKMQCHLLYTMLPADNGSFSYFCSQFQVGRFLCPDISVLGSVSTCKKRLYCMIVRRCTDFVLV